MPAKITWRGHRSAATRELAIQTDASFMRLLPGAEPKEWWTPLTRSTPIAPDKEALVLPIDMDDLGSFKRRVGPRVAPTPNKLARKLIPREPWYRDRTIPGNDLKYDDFAGWPDRLGAILLAARRTPGMILRELLFGAATTVLTVQGIPLISASGHSCNFNDPDASATFGNLVVGNSGSATPGTFDSNGWEYAQERMFQVPGPDPGGEFGLDQDINFVFGGTKMRKKFDRQFKRVIVLDETGAAGVTNIHATEIEGGTIAIVSSWLDRHPFKLANPTLDQWWSLSHTTLARPFGMIVENGGAPTVDVFDEGTEWSRAHDGDVWIKADMDCNGDAAFPQSICEHRGA